ncbi:hypothetical protein E2C01_098201 [Portunus trituberculatus]|uniref:Uncharacterized protein n=1 Tax=Portunus trituberculatus TaxID=210409 RepID=A0A5B7K7S7_PORTR|nr:hypothetical protein [Portunus trituberculatus]
MSAVCSFTARHDCTDYRPSCPCHAHHAHETQKQRPQNVTTVTTPTSSSTYTTTTTTTSYGSSSDSLGAPPLNFQYALVGSPALRACFYDLREIVLRIRLMLEEKDTSIYRYASKRNVVLQFVMQVAGTVRVARRMTCFATPAH